MFLSVSSRTWIRAVKGIAAWLGPHAPFYPYYYKVFTGNWAEMDTLHQAYYSAFGEPAPRLMRLPWLKVKTGVEWAPDWNPGI
jgi:hypothetical protein